MRLRYARLSTAGPVRENNEDWLDFWEPEDPLRREQHGSVALLADGVGGLKRGEVASRLAVEEALREFQAASPGARPQNLLGRMYARACASVHHQANQKFNGQRMATTLVASIFRDRTVTVANVGDSRAYFIRQKTIKRLTTDHVATALPVKLRLMLERQAMASPERSQLTRTLGTEPVCQPDFTSQALAHGDYILHCTDGLHAFVLDEEMREIVSRHHPYDACRELAALAEKRGGDDNISLQLIEVRDWEKHLAQHPPDRRTAVRTAGLLPAPPTGELAPGMILDGRFELTDLVARSNLAAIFRATDRENRRTVAVKVPVVSAPGDEAGQTRFQREEEIGGRIDHPGVLKVIKVGTAKSRPYLVMEFLDGETLAELLSRRKPLPELEARAYAARLCDALAHLHAHRIVHRDLKPQNIMLCRDGSLRLFDFGIARVQQARRLTFAGRSPTLGTPDYISPEQVKGSRGDARSDIYSLGALLYEMVTGVTPFEGESPYVIMNARVTGDAVAPRTLRPELSEAMEEVILHALEREPKARYASALLMKADLEHLDRVAVTDRHQRLRSPPPWKKKRYLWMLVLAFILLQVLLFYGLLWMLRK